MFVLHNRPRCTWEFLRPLGFRLHQHMAILLYAELCPSTSFHTGLHAPPCTLGGTHPFPHFPACQHCTALHRCPCTPAPRCTGILAHLLLVAQALLHTIKLLCTASCTPAPCCMLPVCKLPAPCCTGVPAHPRLLHRGPCTPGPWHTHTHCRGRFLHAVMDLQMLGALTGSNPGIPIVNVRSEGRFQVPL